jgi:hypothetical protein
MLKGEDTRPGKHRSRLVPGQKTGAVFNRQIRFDWDSFKVASSVESIVPILASSLFHAIRVSQSEMPFTAPSHPGEKESEASVDSFAGGVITTIGIVQFPGKSVKLEFAGVKTFAAIPLVQAIDASPPEACETR